MVEHHLAKVRVAGSNPVVRSKQIRTETNQTAPLVGSILQNACTDAADTVVGGTVVEVVGGTVVVGVVSETEVSRLTASPLRPLAGSFSAATVFLTVQPTL